MTRIIHSLRVQCEAGRLQYQYNRNTIHAGDFPHPTFDQTSAQRISQKIFTSLAAQAQALTVDALVIDQLRKSGKELYKELFPDTLLLPQLLQRVRISEKAYLILTLAPKLLWIPWELLHDGELFLCERFRLSRFLERSEEDRRLLDDRLDEKRDGPGALIVLGNTKNLMISEEQEVVENRLRKLYGEYVETLDGKKENDVHHLLQQGYEIFHFIGHGEYREDDREASGWQCARGTILTARTIKEDSTITRFPRLVFANACDSARPSIHDSENFISTLYLALLRRGVSHYIGTLARIPDRLSSEFAREFYEGIKEGETIGDALYKARLRFLKQSGPPIWAYYVHYGDPQKRLVPENQPFEPAKPPSPPRRRPLYSRPVFIVPALLVLLSSLLFTGWRYDLQDLRDYFYTFPESRFGIAVASLAVKDVTRVADHGESLISQPELEKVITEFIPRSEFEVRSFDRKFQSHNEAHDWGKRIKADIVIWGSAERGSGKVIVRLKATRVALPELAHEKETFKRFFLHMLFRDQFRDEQTYDTDFDLSQLSIDLADPTDANRLYQRAGYLSAFLRGLTAYARGDYQYSATVLATVAAQTEAAELEQLAKRWLALCNLNAKKYKDALRAFSPFGGVTSMTDEDRIRFSFYDRCAQEFGKQPATSQSHWEPLLRQTCGRAGLSPESRAICVAMLASGTIGLVAQHEEHVRTKGVHILIQPNLDHVKDLQRLATLAVSDAPESYFPRYVLAMVATEQEVVEAELRQAEQLRPGASEVPFARALLNSVLLSPKNDLAAALEDLDNAILSDPSRTQFWRRKQEMLSELQDCAMDRRVLSDLLDQQIATAESFLQTSHSSRRARHWMLQRLADAHCQAGHQRDALAALNRMVESSSNDPFSCIVAAEESMRHLGAFEDANKFLTRASKLLEANSTETPSFSRTIALLGGELLWRWGKFAEAVSVYSNLVLRDSWRNDPSESLAILSITGNIAHSAGRYTDAERLLRAAKDRAAQTVLGSSSARTSSFQVTLPEKDRRWKWATALDLGLLFLTEGQFADAILQFDEALTHLDKGSSVNSRYRATLTELTYVCQGYAHFKARRYEAATSAWSAATSVNWPYKDEYALQQALERFRSHECQNLDDAMHIVPILLKLNRKHEAAQFIETNGFQTELGATHLYLLGAQGQFQQIESAFASFVRRRKGSVSFQAPFALLSSSLDEDSYIHTDHSLTSDWPESDFFMSVVATDPYPEEPLKVGLTAPHSIIN